MIGRAALTNPWIFKQALDLEGKGIYTMPGLDDRYHIIMEHYSLLIKYLGENKATNIMRGLLLLYTKRLPSRRFLKDFISQIDGKDKLVSIVNEYFGYIREGMASEN
jgi:tRNA-dihydrouridine synthase B